MEAAVGGGGGGGAGAGGGASASSAAALVRAAHEQAAGKAAAEAAEAAEKAAAKAAEAAASAAKAVRRLPYHTIPSRIMPSLPLWITPSLTHEYHAMQEADAVKAPWTDGGESNAEVKHYGAAYNRERKEWTVPPGVAVEPFAFYLFA